MKEEEETIRESASPRQTCKKLKTSEQEDLQWPLQLLHKAGACPGEKMRICSQPCSLLQTALITAQALMVTAQLKVSCPVQLPPFPAGTSQGSVTFQFRTHSRSLHGTLSKLVLAYPLSPLSFSLLSPLHTHKHAHTRTHLFSFYFKNVVRKCLQHKVHHFSRLQYPISRNSRG